MPQSLAKARLAGNSFHPGAVNESFPGCAVLVDRRKGGRENRHIRARLSPSSASLGLITDRYSVLAGFYWHHTVRDVNLLHGLPGIRGCLDANVHSGLSINEALLGRPARALGGQMMLGISTCGSPGAAQPHVCVWACARPCHTGRGRAQGR